MTTGSSPEVVGRFHCTKKRLRQKADVAFEIVHEACTEFTYGLYSVYKGHVHFRKAPVTYLTQPLLLDKG